MMAMMPVLAQQSTLVKLTSAFRRLRRTSRFRRKSYRWSCYVQTAELEVDVFIAWREQMGTLVVSTAL